MSKMVNIDGRFLIKNRPSKRADGFGQNKVKNEALMHHFIVVSDLLRCRFRRSESISWVGNFTSDDLIFNIASLLKKENNNIL